MTKQFRKIDKDVKAHSHIKLTINNVEVDIEKGFRDDVAYAINAHNEMAERIEYLEYAIQQFMTKGRADTSVQKVKYGSACYCGSWFSVIVGHGKAPKHFKAVSDSGVRITARHQNVVAGGGHGENRYVQSEYDVTASGPDGKQCYFHQYQEEIFTITEVIEP